MRVPQDVVDALTICRSYHCTILQLGYENRRLTEYILHLHTTLAANALPLHVPPIPAEIASYVEVKRHRAQMEAGRT